MRACTFFSLADHTSAKTSPPAPVEPGSTTFSVAAVATAASMALPPSMSILKPDMAARG